MEPFSVLMSIYHKEKPQNLRMAFESVFANTLQPNEFILIEDGPLTSELYSIINEFESKYPIFKILKNEKNIGLGLSLAKGIVSSSNEYILRMDSDDVIPKDRFEKQIKELDKGYDVVSCWSALWDSDSGKFFSLKRRPEDHKSIEKLAHSRSPVCHAAVAYKRSAVLKAGNYENHLYYEDYDLWIRMFLSGATFYNIQEYLYYVRMNSDMVGRRGGWRYAHDEFLNFIRFYKLGFYSIKDVIKNTLTHSIVRCMPTPIRSKLLKMVWNKNKVMSSNQNDITLGDSLSKWYPNK